MKITDFENKIRNKFLEETDLKAYKGHITNSDKVVWEEEYVKWLENLVKNNGVLDDVSKQSELLKAFIDFYNYRNTGDKTINNDEIEIFIDSL
tara:strand:- start:53 stop:331 length:279 start_codon:yes stop_codon:yes gene_type:complete